MPHACTEDQLVEQPTIVLVAGLGRTTVSGAEEFRNLRRTGDLLLPRLLSGQVSLKPN